MSTAPAGAMRRGIGQQVRASLGMDLSAVTGVDAVTGDAARGRRRRARASSARRSRGDAAPGHTQRPGRETYNIDFNAPVMGPQRSRPWSALAPRTCVRCSPAVCASVAQLRACHLPVGRVVCACASHVRPACHGAVLRQHGIRVL